MNVWGGFYILLTEYVSCFINLIYTTWHSEKFWTTIFAFPLKVINKEIRKENDLAEGLYFEEGSRRFFGRKGNVTTAGKHPGRCFVNLKQFWYFGIKVSILKIKAIRFLHQVRDNEMKENENFDHNYQFVLLMMFLILSTQERDIREQF